MPILDDTPLLLASASPRRQEILQQLWIPHVVAPVTVDESVGPGETPAAYLERVVATKFAAAVDRLPPPPATFLATPAVLVADTSVIVDGEILGKPRGPGEARAMLGRLAGRRHEVMTRFAIAASAGKHAETVTTEVTMGAVGSSLLDRYARSGEGDDKAGAYAVQGLGAFLVTGLAGSWDNVKGLPGHHVVAALLVLELLDEYPPDRPPRTAGDRSGP